MEELRPSNYLAVLSKYENGCDRQCRSCPAFLQLDKACFFDQKKKWEEWNRLEHIRFQSVMNGGDANV